MLYVGRYATRRTSRTRFFLRANMEGAWSAVTARPQRVEDPFLDPKVQERIGALIASSILGRDMNCVAGAH